MIPQSRIFSLRQDLLFTSISAFLQSKKASQREAFQVFPRNFRPGGIVYGNICRLQRAATRAEHPLSHPRQAGFPFTAAFFALLKIKDTAIKVQANSIATIKMLANMESPEEINSRFALQWHLSSELFQRSFPYKDPDGTIGRESLR